MKANKAIPAPTVGTAGAGAAAGAAAGATTGAAAGAAPTGAAATGSDVDAASVAAGADGSLNLGDGLLSGEWPIPRHTGVADQTGQQPAPDACS